MGLSKYKSKRKFNNTPEPEGAKKSSAGSLSFVIQMHQASHLHYDFRLEVDGVLKSWAVPKGPSLNPADKRLAMMVEDHPYDYKDFEGTIPEGNYGAGTVMIWDEGTYHSIESEDARESEKILKRGLHQGEIKFFLSGKKLRGGFALVKIGNYRGKPTDNSWLLIKERDEYAIDESDVTKLDTSARTDRTLEEIASDKGSKKWMSNKAGKAADSKSKKKPGSKKAKSSDDMPHGISPMLATLTDQAFNDPEWVFEVKWDGFRAIAEIESGEVKLYSRNQQPFNDLFAPIVKSLEKMESDAVLDGEVVVVDENGRSSFQLLQNYQNTGKGHLVYYVFDLLYLDGKDLRELPLLERKKILKSAMPKAKNIRYSDHVPDSGVDFYELAKKQGLEGILAKKSDSEYKDGRRSVDWLKIKTSQRQEAVIGGFTQPRGSRKKFGALVLGVYEKGKLKYIGHTGGGFNDKLLDSIYKKLKPLATDKSPFDEVPMTNAPVTWVKPELIAEVSFAEWTGDGRMRMPIFQGLREDKSPKKVIKEEPAEMKKSFAKRAPKKSDEVVLKISGQKVPVTHLDKVYWPKEKYTKGELIEYYRQIAPVMLPYLKDRAENLNRHPNGIEGQSFYQKDFEHQPPKWAKTKKIYSESNEADINYLVCQNEETLVYMANLGCIEINPWNSRINNLERPDWCVIDLDPEGIGFDKVVETALEVHKILDNLGVPNYAKTSGATGIHIFIPLGGKYDYDLVKQFAHIIATMANEKLPKITSLERMPKKRQRKIYLDYLQNRKGQTLAAPYSVRPKPGATVSTPLEWSEVNKKLDPKKFTMKNIFKRLEKKGDLWKPVLGKGIDLEKVLKKLG